MAAIASLGACSVSAAALVFVFAVAALRPRLAGCLGAAAGACLGSASAGAASLGWGSSAGTTSSMQMPPCPHKQQASGIL